MPTRMRTIPKAYQEIKALDPNTDFTLRALRRMVSNGEIPVIQIASKKLINLDLLLEMLSCYNDSATCASQGAQKLMAYIQKIVNKKGEVKYKIKVSCGYDINNNQITHTMTFTPTATTPRKIEKEVQKQAVLFEQQCKNIINHRSVKFAELADEWLALEESKGQLKTSTLELYKGCRNRTYNCIGHLAIQKIRRADIQNLVNTLAYGLDKKRKLGEKSQKNYICFVSNVFNYAIINEIIEKSPCYRLDFITSPKK